MFSKKNIKDFVIITFGAFLAAVALYFFMLPSNVVVGSASALAMVISNFVPLQVSVINLVLNIILLIIGFILVGSEFGAKTVYTAIMLPVFIGVFEVAFPNFQSLTQDPMLDTLCYVLVVSIAMAILFSCNASSGGLDIVAKIINKFMHVELGKAYSISGIAVALTAAFCYDTKTVILSVLGTYFGGIVVDHFIFGFDLKRRVCIISPKLDEFVDYILHELHSGATLNEITGAYDNTTRQEIITIVDNNEYRKLMDFVRKTDPKAFVTVYSVSEIQYQPKVRNKERDK
ncbi:MAG: YitT family protein [Clostridia bacterium]|nr:YitT family protein [Clostridia bacterium]